MTDGACRMNHIQCGKPRFFPLFLTLLLFHSLIVILGYLWPLTAVATPYSNSTSNLTSKSTDISAEQWVQRANKRALHSSPGWLALLYYQPTGWRNRALISDIDDDAFFLAETGKRNPAAELEATLRALFQSKSANLDRHAQCVFPARTHWLKHQLNIKDADLPDVECPAFDAWAAAFKATSVSLIFPAAYLDSPSSMFGHTLLRFDQPVQQDTSSLLSYTVSYAAQKAPEDSELAFVYRGLVGGYPGETSVRPYYQKIKEYSRIESRDIWEFRLSFTEAEVAQLIRHVWEIKDARIEYFFFSQNCSYRVMALLNVVRPTSGVLEEYPAYTIPIETVRDAYQFDWVESAKFRPSVITHFYHHIAQLTEAEQQLVYQLVVAPAQGEPQLQALPKAQQKKLLTVAYEYSRLVRFLGESARSVSFNLLQQLSEFEQLSESESGPETDLTPVPEPAQRDDQGHRSGRWTLGAGLREDSSFGTFSWRPAYHDLTDAGLGYPPGSELKFLEMEGRLYETGDLQMEDLTVIGIKSIKPRNRFLKSTSWSVELGAHREGLEHDQLTPFLQGQMGYAYQWRGLVGYGLVGGEFQLSDHHGVGYDALFTPTVGAFQRTGFGQWSLDATLYSSITTGLADRVKIDLTGVYNLGEQSAIRLRASEVYQQAWLQSEVAVDVMLYF